MENNLKELNKLLASYEQVASITVYPTEFEKTPKRSIKRYLYNTDSAGEIGRFDDARKIAIEGFSADNPTSFPFKQLAAFSGGKLFRRLLGIFRNSPYDCPYLSLSLQKTGCASENDEQVPVFFSAFTIFVFCRR